MSRSEFFFASVSEVLVSSSPEDRAIVANLPRAIIHFNLQQAGSWILDTKSNVEPELYKGEPDLQAPDCVLISTESSMLELLSASRSRIMALFMSGKITIRGQHTVFAELRPLFAQATKRMKIKLEHLASVDPDADPSEMHHRKVSLPPQGIQFISRASSRWQPDERAIHCHECNETFSTFTRKHHCRLCGIVYCHDCSSYLIDGQRSCQRCFKSVKRQLIASMQQQYNAKEAAVAATLPETKTGYTIATPPLIAPTPPPDFQYSSTSGVPGSMGIARFVSTPSSSATPRTNYTQTTTLTLPPTQTSDGPPMYSSTYTVPVSPSPFLSSRLQENSAPESLLQSSMEHILQAFVNEPIGCTFPHLYVIGSDGDSTDTTSKLQQLQSQLARMEQTLHERVTTTRISQITFILFVAIISILTTKVPDTFWTSSYDTISKHIISFITSLDLPTRTSHLYTSSLTFLSSITYITWSIFILGLCIGLYLTCLLQNEWFLLKRRSRIYYVAARVIGGYLWLKYSQKLCRTKEPALTAQWERAHEKYAALVQYHIVTLQGFWIKVGQYLSSRADVVPEAWIRELSKLQDSVPASSYQHVASVIREDFGNDIDSIFSSFDEIPLAAASIAQVHKAVLKDGTKVVAKVQHPNIATIMPSDFVNLARITSWVAYFEPDFDFTPVLREWSTEAIKELDFNHESCNMSRVQSNLAISGLNVVLPSIIPGLVSARVIVMTFMDGFKITDTTSLDKYGIDRLQLLRRIAQAYAHQIYIDGFFNADPHPGNILVQIHQGKVRPVLLDFGLTKELPVKMRHAFAMMVSSVADANYGGLLTAFQTMGLQLKRDDPLEDMRAIRFLLRDTAPPKEARAEIMKWREEMEEKRNKLPKKLRNPVEAWPGELLFFFRVTLLIRGLCSALQVRLPTMEILAPYAKMSLIRRYEIHDHAMSIIYPTPILSSLEAKIRTLLTRLYAQGEFVGLQVCVYQRDKKIVDTSAGTLGVVDPRPVRPDTLFNGFSVTKGVCAVLLHMLADRRYAASRIPGARPIDFNQLMTSYWPAFGTNGKQTCTVAQAVSHQAGLQNAVSTKTPIDEMIQWDVMLKTIEEATPVTPPGVSTVYHYLAYGFIVGGLVQHVTGRHIRELVHDHIAMPLGIEHEMMMGLEEGMNQERRLATLSNGFFNTSSGLPTGTDLKQIMSTLREMRSKQNGGAGSVAGAASAFFGTRRPQSFTFNIEQKYDSNTTETADAAAGAGNEENDDISALLGGINGMGLNGDTTSDVNGKPGALTLIDPCLFNLPKLRTACIPAANGHFSARALARLYACLACHGELDGVRLMSPEQVMQMKQIQTEWTQVGIKFGLGTIIYGFEDSASSQPRYSGFGHSGLGGSLGFCDTHTGVSVAIMVNKLSFHKTATNELVQLIASELGMGQPLGGQLR